MIFYVMDHIGHLLINSSCCQKKSYEKGNYSRGSGWRSPVFPGHEPVQGLANPFNSDIVPSCVKNTKGNKEPSMSLDQNSVIKNHKKGRAHSRHRVSDICLLYLCLIHGFIFVLFSDFDQSLRVYHTPVHNDHYRGHEKHQSVQ